MPFPSLSDSRPLAFVAGLCLLLAFGLLAPAASAQPFVVDDAGITDPGACQLEAWADRRQGWVIPACTPLSRTEFTLELGFIEEPHGGHTHLETELVAETKVQLLADDPGTLGLAVVAGVTLHPGHAEPLEETYVFAPLTFRLADDRAALHLYGGWLHDRGDDVHLALYGVRTDVSIVGELSAYAEVYGEGPDDIGYQVALRAGGVPGRFDVVAGYGGAFRGEAPATGVLIGIAWTPPQFFRPLRP